MGQATSSLSRRLVRVLHQVLSPLAKPLPSIRQQLRLPTLVRTPIRRVTTPQTTRTGALARTQQQVPLEIRPAATVGLVVKLALPRTILLRPRRRIRPLQVEQQVIRPLRLPQRRQRPRQNRHSHPPRSSNGWTVPTRGRAVMLSAQSMSPLLSRVER